MKKHLPLICIVALLIITTLSNCNKDNTGSNSFADGVAGLYHNNTYAYDITVTKINNNTISITTDYFINFNNAVMTSATTFTLNKVTAEDPGNYYEYTGDGSCSNNNIAVNIHTMQVEKSTGDTTRYQEFFTGTKTQ